MFGKQISIFFIRKMTGFKAKKDGYILDGFVSIMGFTQFKLRKRFYFFFILKRYQKEDYIVDTIFHTGFAENDFERHGRVVFRGNR